MIRTEAATPRSVIRSRAEKIATFIARTNSDNRGDLLLEVAKILKGNGQAYTAKLLAAVASEYGVNRPQ